MKSKLKYDKLKDMDETKEELVENVDYYVDELGRWVFTENYHLKRGFCCKNNCKHCPYEKSNL